MTVLDVGILTAPNDTKVEAGKAVTFSCDVTMNTEFVPTVVWYKSSDKENALAVKEDKIAITASDADESRLSKLVISAIEVTDKGNPHSIILT